MNTINYSKIRFIGYAIPTGPSQDQLIASRYICGAYLGATDLDQDIQARVSILKSAVDIAKKALPQDEDVLLVNNVFMAPEFFFHGALGPYIYETVESDPVKKIQDLLRETFNAYDYPNWTFVFGTVISAKVANLDRVFQSQAVQMHKKLVRGLAESAQLEFGNSRGVTEQILNEAISDLRVNPAVEVRDRALVFSNLPFAVRGDSREIHALTVEKYFLSSIDFLLFEKENKNVITEEMVAYPHIDLSNGDWKKLALDAHAVFQQTYGSDDTPSHINIGVEICLDHDDARLRKNMALPLTSEHVDALHIQLIPSCGSAIVPQSVSVAANGFVFNCDGWCAFDGSTTPQQGEEGGMQFLYTNYIARENQIEYKAHTQLARVATPALGNDPNLFPAQFQTLTAVDAKCISVAAPILDEGVFEDYFAGGSGAIHIYGLEVPFALDA